jgi:hypothetical protein
VLPSGLKATAESGRALPQVTTQSGPGVGGTDVGFSEDFAVGFSGTTQVEIVNDRFWRETGVADCAGANEVYPSATSKAAEPQPKNMWRPRRLRDTNAKCKT